MLAFVVWAVEKEAPAAASMIRQMHFIRIGIINNTSTLDYCL
jgi:hypothetical protein